jgi:hypothetical protein
MNNDTAELLLERLNRIESALEMLIHQRTVKDWYSTEEVAELLHTVAVDGGCAGLRRFGRRGVVGLPAHRPSTKATTAAMASAQFCSIVRPDAFRGTKSWLPSSSQWTVTADAGWYPRTSSRLPNGSRVP